MRAQPRMAWLVVGVVLTGCGPSEARKTSVRSALTRLARSVEDRTYTREVRRGQAKLPGSFGEAFDARKAERAAVEASAELAKKCLDTLARPGGADDPAKQSCARDLETSQAAMEALLDLGRAERPGTPPSVHPFAPMTPPVDTHRSFGALCKRAAAQVELEVVQGRAAAGALTCARALEVARDYGLGASAVGAVMSASCVEILDPPCGRAIDALPAEARATVRADLEAVASTLPSIGDVLDAETSSVNLLVCASLLDPSDRAQLGPRGRALVESNGVAPSGSPLERAQVATLCVEGFEDMQLVTAAHRHPPGSQERAKLLAQRKSRTPLFAGVAYDKYEDELTAMASRVRALARR